jgi:type II secretory pathway component GspD/PulD (secretin)
MRKLILYVCVALWLVWLYVGMLADVRGAELETSPAAFDLSRVRVAELVQVVYRDVLKRPYLIDAEVLKDDREISLRFQFSKHLDADAADLLESLGLLVVKRNGLSVVSIKKSEAEAPNDVFVYRPRYRDASYLAELVGPLFKGRFTITRTIASAAAVPPKNADAAPAGSAAALIDRNSDALVFHGQTAEVRQLEKLLMQLDDRQGEVMVRGVVYEVGSSDKDGSAFSLALSLLGGKFSLTGGASTVLENSVRFKNVTIDAVASALSLDSRFKVVSSPSLRVRSGGSGRFSVGQEVPVLGALTFVGNGQAPVQSVEYRSSGVIFDLQPLVREAVVDLTVMQQVSSFVATDTGVNGSPTLIKREVKTALSMADGDIVVLGGLAENKSSAGRNGLSFLPSFLHAKSNESSRSEILLILQLTKI